MRCGDEQSHALFHGAGWVMRGNCLRGLICLAVLAVGFCGLGNSQDAASGVPPNQNPAAPAQDNSQNKTTKASRQELQSQQRKDQLTADTAKLLELANELKAEMDKSTKDTLSITVLKKADQVEKLAHKVRDEMKLSIGN
jgi:hypothetical protein